MSLVNGTLKVGTAVTYDCGIEEDKIALQWEWESEDHLIVGHDGENAIVLMSFEELSMLYFAMKAVRDIAKEEEL